NRKPGESFAAMLAPVPILRKVLPAPRGRNCKTTVGMERGTPDGSHPAPEGVRTGPQGLEQKHLGSLPDRGPKHFGSQLPPLGVEPETLCRNLETATHLP